MTFSKESLARILSAYNTGSNYSTEDISERHIAAINAIRRYAPQRIGTAAALSSTGGSLAQENTLSNFYGYVQGVVNAVVKYNATWEQACSEVDDYDEQMRLAWNFCNVAQETGIGSVADCEMFIHLAVDRFKSVLPLLKPDEYWRGVAAAYLTAENPYRGNISHADESFIDWAGSYEDISAVIFLARERRTTDVDTLRYLLEENGNHSAIGRGTL